MPVAVVTGANSGIGRATAIHLAGQGYDVYGTVRSRERAGKLATMSAERGVEVRLVELDVADDESVRAGFAEIHAAAGPVDVLVNNAGVGSNGVLEDTPTAEYLDVFNVNVCGIVRCTQAVLPGMRERGSGTIVNISSVTGKVASLAQQPYVTSKWAVEGLSEGLAQEVAPFGIRVVIIEPGITKSAIFAKNVDVPEGTGAYGTHYERLFQMYAVGIENATDPFEVAEVIHHAVTTDSARLRYEVSWGSAEMIAGRQRMSDDAWVGLGALEENADYYDRFRALFGLDISPG